MKHRIETMTVPASTSPALRRPGRLLACLGAALLLASCGGAPPPAMSRAPAHAIIYSPNAEPLTGGPLGHPSCEEAQAQWFDRTDANHDGTLSREEFLADARQQFARMDIRHAGFVTSADLTQYRLPYDDAPPPAREMRRGPGAGPRASSVDTRPDPVMSADKSLKFRVTEEDFLAQATAIFSALERAGSGRVGRETVVATCRGNERTR